MLKLLGLVVLLGICLHNVAAVIHSQKMFFTASSGVSGFPEFVALTMIDDVQVNYYDSDGKELLLKQDWMKKIVEEDPQYQERNAQIAAGQHQAFRGNIDIAKQRFNQTGGVHIVQNIYGCKWDDEAGQVTGYKQDGLDGKDFMASIMETNTWIGPKLKDENTTNKSNNNKASLAPWENCYCLIYPEWRRKYMNE